MVESINWSILVRRKLSFMHALLRLVKSMHILYFPLTFFINTTLEIHSGLLTFRIKSTCRCFSTLTFMVSYLSWLKLFFLYFTSLAFLLIANLWQANLGFIPGMSTCDQANTLTWACMHSTSLVFSSCPNVDLIFTVFYGSPYFILTVSVSSTSSCISFFFLVS